MCASQIPTREWQPPSPSPGILAAGSEDGAMWPNLSCKENSLQHWVTWSLLSRDSFWPSVTPEKHSAGRTCRKCASPIPSHLTNAPYASNQPVQKFQLQRFPASPLGSVPDSTDYQLYGFIPTHLPKTFWDSQWMTTCCELLKGKSCHAYAQEGLPGAIEKRK